MAIVPAWALGAFFQFLNIIGVSLFFVVMAPLLAIFETLKNGVVKLFYNGIKGAFWEKTHTFYEVTKETIFNLGAKIINPTRDIDEEEVKKTRRLSDLATAIIGLPLALSGILPYLLPVAITGILIIISSLLGDSLNNLVADLRLEVSEDGSNDRETSHDVNEGFPSFPNDGEACVPGFQSSHNGQQPTSNSSLDSDSDSQNSFGM